MNQKRLPEMDLGIPLEIRDLAYIQESILVRKAFRCGPVMRSILTSFREKDLG